MFAKPDVQFPSMLFALLCTRMASGMVLLPVTAPSRKLANVFPVLANPWMPVQFGLPKSNAPRKVLARVIAMRFLRISPPAFMKWRPTLNENWSTN